jgi:hypothetical protein
MPARSLAGAAHDGPRDGSTSAAGGPEPRAVTRRPFFTAEHGEHGEDRTRAAARWRGAEGGVDPARPWPGVIMKKQWRRSASVRTAWLSGSVGPGKQSAPILLPAQRGAGRELEGEGRGGEQAGARDVFDVPALASRALDQVVSPAWARVAPTRCSIRIGRSRQTTTKASHAGTACR